MSFTMYNDEFTIKQRIVDGGVIVRSEEVSAQWGKIVGDINSQIDLKDALSAKADADDVYSKSEVDEKFMHSDLDLSGYALKTDLDPKADITYVDNKLTQYQPIGNYLTEIPSNYITESKLSAKEYLTKSEAISSYATKTDISTKVEKAVLESTLSQYQPIGNYLTEIPSTYVTEAELEDKKYLTQHQDISGLATKIELSEGLVKKVDLTALDSTLTYYQKKSELENILTNYPTLSELNARDYVTASEISDYATKADISGYASISYVDSIVGEIDKVLDEINGNEIILG